MTSLDRRTFLRRAGGAILAPSLAGLAAWSVGPRKLDAAKVVRASRGGRAVRRDYGRLVVSRDAPELLLPESFRAARISVTGEASLADPLFTIPNGVDGMAAFPGPEGTVRLVRNHEIADPRAIARPFGSDRIYDPRTGGGTTTVEVRFAGTRADRSIEVLREFPSLNGTHLNCAGGPTPFGSWLSCEETTIERDRKHGYVFEVPSLGNAAADPVPLTAMGRFTHEAVAVDPRTGVVYQTEDIRYEPQNGLPGSGFYRFLPIDPRNLHAGGALQMLAVRERPAYVTATGQTPGLVLAVTWVAIDEPDPDAATSDPSAVFRQGVARGGALFHRLEGCWHGDGTIYFNATAGGDAGAGQVWQYRPGSAEIASDDGGELALVFESPGADVLDSPDNICVSPRGGLVLCEDGEGVQYVRGLTREGAVFDLVATNGPLSEFAGACFSPDGEVMFLNLQGSTSSASSEFGATYAIWGPWDDGAL